MEYSNKYFDDIILSICEIVNKLYKKNTSGTLHFKNPQFLSIIIKSRKVAEICFTIKVYLSSGVDQSHS